MWLTMSADERLLYDLASCADGIPKWADVNRVAGASLADLSKGLTKRRAALAQAPIRIRTLSAHIHPDPNPNPNPNLYPDPDPILNPNRNRNPNPDPNPHQALIPRDELCSSSNRDISAAARAAYARLYGAVSTPMGGRFPHRTKFQALKADLSALCAAQVLV